MNVTIINPFLNSAISMFQEMFNLTPQHGAPYIVTGSGNHRWEISGIIGIVGDTEGVIVIRLPRSLAVRLLIESGMNVQSNDVDDMIHGMVGEFANIISGNALNKISQKKIDITVPITVQGKNHTINWPNKGAIIGLPFTTAFGSFEMQINISTS
ncbi:chemotaxis protein CheX [Thiospirochaeta perfilievii]|uniref:Chemotaxis protein CheX n=1 Tax=Thiospirochaeta perfilievii TaxID=252967 RepID=A0A5C1QA63_9SPIO|nr:chemotaxis protein CheX [Thiospirochaeta perfilievii]QEN03544.1 chemotaxis protein CheX [Thiospirochaeta perfilievii]